MKNKIKQGLAGLLLTGALATTNYDSALAQDKNQDFWRSHYQSTADWIMNMWENDKKITDKKISFYQNKLEENKGDELKEIKYGLAVVLYENHKLNLDLLMCKPYLCSSLEEDNTPLVNYFMERFQRKD
ncbi:MAG: hypothetical protein ACMXX9_04190 [Candidatus Woesearchaeota archaeon]